MVLMCLVLTKAASPCFVCILMLYYHIKLWSHPVNHFGMEIFWNWGSQFHSLAAVAQITSPVIVKVYYSSCFCQANRANSRLGKRDGVLRLPLWPVMSLSKYTYLLPLRSLESKDKASLLLYSLKNYCWHCLYNAFTYKTTKYLFQWAIFSESDNGRCSFFVAFMDGQKVRFFQSIVYI
jgi:hypothetical protein